MSTMVSANSLAEVASLIGDGARANMLSALMGGLALTAGELAAHAGVTAQTASGHLAKLTAAGLITVVPQGRHRYYRLATPEAVRAIDALMMLAASGPPRHHRLGPKDQALRLARSCYDHLAGRLAVRLAEALTERAYLVLGEDAALITETGQRFFCAMGLDLAPDSRTRRPLCRTCLDWSERRPHLAGRLGAALFDHCLGQGWLARRDGSRALRITPVGELALSRVFALPSDWRHG